MTGTAQTRTTDPAAIEPSGKFSLLQMVPTLAIDVVVPVIAYNVLTHFGTPVLWALVAGGLAPAINNLRVWMKSRRLEPLGITVIMFLVIGTSVSALAGSVFIALIKDSFLTGTFGLICLVSLFASRPLLFVILRQFVAGEDPARIAWWNSLYEFPRFRDAIRFVTVVWGIVYLIEACVRVGFALTLKPGQVVAISPAMAAGMLVLLIVWTRRHMLAVREERLREQRNAGTS